MLQKIKEIIAKLSASGIPVPVFRDAVTGLPSITYTMFYMNGFIAIGGLLGRFTNLVSAVDMSSARELLIVTGTIYLGRAITKSLTPDPTTTPTEGSK